MDASLPKNMAGKAAGRAAAHVRMFIYFAAGMAGFLFGLDQGVISEPCRLSVKNGIYPVRRRNGWSAR